MALHLTKSVGWGWLGGLLVAAPFAAVMSTVDSFMLMISSSVVRDVYQRNINAAAPERRIRRLSYLCTLAAGFGAHLSLYAAGALFNGSFFVPAWVFNLDPIILGLVISFVAVPPVSWRTAPVSPELVRDYFHR